MIGSGTFRLEPPRLRTTEDPSSERHATWYELFFDLVFAAAVVELATALADDPTSAVFGRFAGLFVAISWAWTGFAVYANRFDTDDLIYRLIKAGAAFATAAIAIEIPRLMAGDGGSMAFAIGYAVVRLLLVALYVRARLHVRGRGPAADRHLHRDLHIHGLPVARVDSLSRAVALPPLGPGPRPRPVRAAVRLAHARPLAHRGVSPHRALRPVLHRRARSVGRGGRRRGCRLPVQLRGLGAGRSLLRHRALPVVDLLRPRGHLGGGPRNPRARLTSTGTSRCIQGSRPLRQVRRWRSRRWTNPVSRPARAGRLREGSWPSLWPSPCCTSGRSGPRCRTARSSAGSS